MTLLRRFDGLKGESHAATGYSVSMVLSVPVAEWQPSHHSRATNERRRFNYPPMTVVGDAQSLSQGCDAYTGTLTGIDYDNGPALSLNYMIYLHNYTTYHLLLYGVRISKRHHFTREIG